MLADSSVLQLGLAVLLVVALYAGAVAAFLKVPHVAVAVTVVCLATLGSAASEGPARRPDTAAGVALLVAAVAVAGLAALVVRAGWANAAGATAGLAFGGTAVSARAEGWCRLIFARARPIHT